jgi:hypothetical protein
MKTSLRRLSSAATVAAFLTFASSASMQNDTLVKIANYKQWSQVTQDVPAGSVIIDGASLAG